VDRLVEDHANARVLAEGLAELTGIALNPEKVRTNIVSFDVTAPGGAEGLVKGLKADGVLCNVSGPGRIRMVTHYGIVRADVERAVRCAREVLEGVTVGAR
ncbi:MAG: threonine aldolase, partial [Chloroflexota bacterium]